MHFDITVETSCSNVVMIFLLTILSLNCVIRRVFPILALALNSPFSILFSTPVFFFPSISCFNLFWTWHVSTLTTIRPSKPFYSYFRLGISLKQIILKHDSIYIWSTYWIKKRAWNINVLLNMFWGLKTSTIPFVFHIRMLNSETDLYLWNFILKAVLMALWLCSFFSVIFFPRNHILNSLKKKCFISRDLEVVLIKF